MFDIYDDLQNRGLVHQTTDDGLQSWLNAQPRTVYVGFDPTADSMHVGHLMGLMTLHRFQSAGHKPIALVGGATGMIGDPSGKSQERNLLSVDELRHNTDAMAEQMKSFLDFDSGENAAELVNNLDWMQGFSYIEFLRDIGKNFPVNVMMGKDSVKSRLDRTDSGLSYTEFSYMLLQAYDFAHLNQQFGCEIQAGGSDQWGNITAGIDLGRRMHSVSLYGLTWPLLTKSDGAKMGKTESGAIWLSPERTSPYKFYQYWINVADDDAGKCLRFLTDLSISEIENLDRSREEEPHRRESQKKLAESVTSLVHGDSGLHAAIKATEVLFGAEIENLTDAELLDIFADVPSVEIAPDRLSGGELSMIDMLVESGLCSSKGESRRTIEQGGGYINNRRVDALDRVLSVDDLASETVIVLRRGKKKFALARFPS